MRSELVGLVPYDCLYISPHAEDAALSCAGGIHEERSRGLSVLVASVFGPEPGAAGPTRRLGADVVSLGLPETRPQPSAAPFHALLDEDSREHAARVEEVGVLLNELVRRVQPRHVYAPLAVWAHPDHRATHQAARQVLETRAGRDVFLYEERPAALIPGAVRVRLSQLGARLPPVAAEFSDDAGLVRHVVGIVRNRWVRQHFTGFVDGLRFTRGAARAWRVSRQWRPLRAFGLRLQPVLHPVADEALERLAGSAPAFASGFPLGAPERLVQLAARHGRRLGGDGPLERYWLLLPARGDVPSDLADATQAQTA
jgi:LmbE family N-acetylglucosaminyl deacetylase